MLRCEKTSFNLPASEIIDCNLNGAVNKSIYLSIGKQAWADIDYKNNCRISSIWKQAEAWGVASYKNSTIGKQAGAELDFKVI